MGPAAPLGPFVEQFGPPLELTTTAWVDVPGVLTSYAIAGEVRVRLTAKVRAARPGGGLEECLLSMGPATIMNESLLVPTPADGTLSGHVTVARSWQLFFFPGTGTAWLKLKARRADDLSAGRCVVEAATLEVETR